MITFFLAMLLHDTQDSPYAPIYATSMYSCSVPYPEHQWASLAQQGVAVKCTDGYYVYRGTNHWIFECLSSSNISRDGCSYLKPINERALKTSCFFGLMLHYSYNFQCLNSKTGRRYFLEFNCTGSDDIGWTSNFRCHANDTLLPFTVAPELQT